MTDIGEVALEIVAGIRLKPGIYTDISAAEYHADCVAPEPSLSSSVAKLLVEQSPLHAFYAHPRLNPSYEGDGDSSRRLDLGSIAHALLLNQGRTIEVIEADSYRTKDAQAQRDAARRAGLLPVLTADHERAKAMAAVAMQAIQGCWIGHMWNAPAAVSEAVAIWREGDAWCRSMIDRTDMRTVLDYKTTQNAAPAVAAKHLYSMGYHIQRSFYLRGLDAIDPSGAGRRKFLFLFQEIDPPYACSLLECDGAGAMLGDRLVDQAIRIWTDCLAADRWPSYPTGIHRAELPPWIENSILAQEERDDERERVPTDLLMGG